MNKNYKLIKNEFIKEINTNATLLEHIKSGARVLLLQNDDENKVFQIGFKTPPTDESVSSLVSQTQSEKNENNY